MNRKMMQGLVAVAAAVVLAGCDRGFDPAAEIGLVSREDGSGTRSAFIELTGIQTKGSDGRKIDRTSPTTMIASSTAVALTTVAGDPASLGYLSLGAVNDSVKIVKVDGVAPTREDIAAGRYALVHPFNVVTKGPIEALKPAARDFLNWILSEEGQRIVERAGYLRVSTVIPYTGAASVAGKVVCSGSSSVTPCMEKLKEAYCRTHVGVSIEVQQSDSSSGVADARDGVCDLGMASRALKGSESGSGLVATPIALDGLAVVVSPLNPIESISKEHLRKAFTGEISTWSQMK
ncbi:MAG: substrate-binding domain-containing protein [Kiritimatiellia bacterium]